MPLLAYYVLRMTMSSTMITVTTNPFRGDVPGTVDKIKWAAEDMEAAIRNRK